MEDTPTPPRSLPKRSKKRRGPSKKTFDPATVRTESYKGIEAKEAVSDLPRWARLALAECVNVGTTLKDAAEKFGKSKSALDKYSRSPAGRKWRAELERVADSPERVSMAIMRASLANVTLDYLMALESAIEANDYKEVGVMSRDLMDRLGMKKKSKEAATKPTLVINFGSANASALALDMPQVETTHQEVIDDPDYEVVDG